MSQVTAKDLDFSVEMRSYFEAVRRLLVERHEKSPHDADMLVDRYFGLTVEPLERALVMHDDVSSVAEDLAKLPI